jgi:hypothetical protein
MAASPGQRHACGRHHQHANLITLNNTGYADAAGNAGAGTTDSNNYAIDTQRPTATIVVPTRAWRWARPAHHHLQRGGERFRPLPT